jgi:hypothetical protein
VATLKVTPDTPLLRFISVQVTVAFVAAERGVPTVTTREGPATIADDINAIGVVPIVIAHLAAPYVEKTFGDGVMVTVPVGATGVTGVNAKVMLPFGPPL